MNRISMLIAFFSMAACTPALKVDQKLASEAERAANLISELAPTVVDTESFYATSGKPEVSEPVGVSAGSTVVQKLPNCGPLVAVRLQVPTWGKKPSDYDVLWTVRDAAGGVVGSGSIEADRLTEWQFVKIAFTETSSSMLEFSFAGDASGPVEAPIGFPVGAALHEGQTLIQDGKEVRPGGALEMELQRPKGKGCGEPPVKK